MPRTSIFHLAKRILAAVSPVLLSLGLVTCGGGGSTGVPIYANSALAGNWQFNLLQEEPVTATPALSVSGFFQQAGSSLTGNVQVPPSTQNSKCGGVGSLSGTVSGEAVTLSIATGGTTLVFTGVISQDSKTMAGTYSGLGGGCFSRSTSGTWSAVQIPALNGSFSGTLSNSAYMEALLGESTVPPIAVSGTMTQGGNTGASIATLTGTITAVGYPCFSTASLRGTISGQSVILSIFSYNGVEIGSIGSVGYPATVIVSSSGVSLVGKKTSQQGLALASGTCPRVNGVSGDGADLALTFN